MFFKTALRMFIFNFERNIFTKRSLIVFIIYISVGLYSYFSMPVDNIIKVIEPFMGIIIPITALFLGITIFSEDIEENTLLYLFTKPLSKAGILTGKYLSFIAICSVMIIFSFISVIVSIMFTQYKLSFSLFKNIDLLIASLFLSLCIYGSIFIFLSLIFKRPLLYGFGFLFGWENVISRIPASISKLTVKYYLYSFTKEIVPVKSFASSFIPNSISFQPLYYSTFILLILSSIFIFLSFLVFKNKEYTFIVDSY